MSPPGTAGIGPAATIAVLAVAALSQVGPGGLTPAHATPARQLGGRSIPAGMAVGSHLVAPATLGAALAVRDHTYSVRNLEVS